MATFEELPSGVEKRMALVRRGVQRDRDPIITEQTGDDILEVSLQLSRRQGLG